MFIEYCFFLFALHTCKFCKIASIICRGSLCKKKKKKKKKKYPEEHSLKRRHHW